MELSELQKFAGELLAVDDRTGVVYSIENEIVVPRYILVDGNGHSKKVRSVACIACDRKGKG
jgi:hypothetical protein